MSEHTIGRRDWLKTLATGAALGAVGAAARPVSAAAETRATVPTKELGTTGRRIPILLLGGGEGFDPVYDKVLHTAYKEGATYIDTAESYVNGQSHVSVGNFIEQIGDRDKLWITSKVALAPATATPKTYADRIEACLPALRTDYLDMFFMHEVRTLRVLEPEFIRMGDDLKKRGKIKHFGFSCHSGNVVALMNKAAGIGAPGIDAIMFRYNFAKYGDLELNKAMDACKKAGIGLIAMKTQSSVPKDHAEVRKFTSANFTLGQAKLKAVWADERIDAAISHMTNLNLLRENLDAAKSPAQLSMDEYMQLNRYAARTASQRCQGCNEICESRIDGDLRVADTLRYLMYAECYGRRDEARTLYTALHRRERDFQNVDLAAATRACPQGIDIAARLADARTLLA